MFTCWEIYNISDFSPSKFLLWGASHGNITCTHIHVDSYSPRHKSQLCELIELLQLRFFSQLKPFKHTNKRFVESLKKQRNAKRKLWILSFTCQVNFCDSVAFHFPHRWRSFHIFRIIDEGKKLNFEEQSAQKKGFKFVIASRAFDSHLNNFFFVFQSAGTGDGKCAMDTLDPEPFLHPFRSIIDLVIISKTSDTCLHLHPRPPEIIKICGGWALVCCAAFTWKSHFRYIFFHHDEQSLAEWKTSSAEFEVLCDATSENYCRYLWWCFFFPVLIPTIVVVIHSRLNF
jgi:hypothetical protein